MLTIKINLSLASLDDIEAIAKRVNKIGASLGEETDLLLEVGSLDYREIVNVVAVAADGSVADKS